MWEGSNREQGFTFIRGVVTDIRACHKQRRAKTWGWSIGAFGDVVGEDGLHAVGNVGKCELLDWGLQGGNSGELLDHMVGEGKEED